MPNYAIVPRGNADSDFSDEGLLIGSADFVTTSYEATYIVANYQIPDVVKVRYVPIQGSYERFYAVIASKTSAEVVAIGSNLSTTKNATVNEDVTTGLFYSTIRVTRSSLNSSIPHAADNEYSITDALTLMNDTWPVYIDNVTIADVPDQTYTGEEITPGVSLTYNETELVEDTDYTLTYQDNIDIGEAWINITGIGNFTGLTATSFEIVEEGPGPGPEPTQERKVLGMTGGYVMVDCEGLDLTKGSTEQTLAGLYAALEKAIDTEKPVQMYNCNLGEGGKVTPLLAMLAKGENSVIATANTLQITVTNANVVTIVNLTDNE